MNYNEFYEEVETSPGVRREGALESSSAISELLQEKEELSDHIRNL